MSAGISTLTSTGRITTVPLFPASVEVPMTVAEKNAGTLVLQIPPNRYVLIEWGPSGSVPAVVAPVAGSPGTVGSPVLKGQTIWQLTPQSTAYRLSVLDDGTATSIDVYSFHGFIRNPSSNHNVPC